MDRYLVISSDGHAGLPRNDIATISRANTTPSSMSVYSGKFSLVKSMKTLPARRLQHQVAGACGGRACRGLGSGHPQPCARWRWGCRRRCCSPTGSPNATPRRSVRMWGCARSASLPTAMGGSQGAQSLAGGFLQRRSAASHRPGRHPRALRCRTESSGDSLGPCRRAERCVHADHHRWLRDVQSHQILSMWELLQDLNMSVHFHSGGAPAYDTTQPGGGSART